MSMEQLKSYTDQELVRELERLDALLARKKHQPANLTTQRDNVIAERKSRIISPSELRKFKC